MSLFKTKREFALVFLLLVFGAIPIMGLLLVYPSDFSLTKEINSEIVIGILTVAGLIFAFQPTVFRGRKTGFYRLLFLAIFSVEGLVLGIVGYGFTVDAINSGYLTTRSLLAVTASLLLNLTMSVYFVLVDLVIQTEDEIKGV